MFGFGKKIHVHDWYPPELVSINTRTLMPTGYRRMCRTCEAVQHQQVTYKEIRSRWGNDKFSLRTIP